MAMDKEWNVNQSSTHINRRSSRPQNSHSICLINYKYNPYNPSDIHVRAGLGAGCRDYYVNLGLLFQPFPGTRRPKSHEFQLFCW